MGYPTPAMPLLSRGAPVFASSGDAKGANDDNPSSGWGTSATPAWLAYDLSGAPEAERQRVLLSWYAIHAPCYIDNGQDTGNDRPIAYTIETSSAPGGAMPPADGWETVLTVNDNRYCGRQHLVDLKGANWIRMNVSKTSSSSGSAFFEMDVQGTSAGASDAWLFMGDSITYMTMTHAFCDLPNLVLAGNSSHYPAVIDAALGGTNTSTAAMVIDDTMKDFPGRFVVLAYGTNDHPQEFQMEALVKAVLAKGKVPVIPHMPWAQGKEMDGEGVKINALIDALYQKYPQIIHGPDLWAFFMGRTDLIPPGDVHPNGMGQEELRKQWAKAMQTVY
jgi:hypothetical protein